LLPDPGWDAATGQTVRAWCKHLSTFKEVIQPHVAPSLSVSTSPTRWCRRRRKPSPRPAFRHAIRKHPFDDRSLDALICAFGLRHLADPALPKRIGFLYQYSTPSRTGAEPDKVEFFPRDWRDPDIRDVKCSAPSQTALAKVRAPPRKWGEARATLLKERGVSLVDVVRAFGKDLSFVSRVNRGQRRSQEIEAAIARRLGLSMGEAFPEWRR
jgi:hypothetical protein